jgi:hypothetical protein
MCNKDVMTKEELAAFQIAEELHTHLIHNFGDYPTRTWFMGIDILDKRLKNINGLPVRNGEQ